MHIIVKGLYRYRVLFMAVRSMGLYNFRELHCHTGKEILRSRIKLLQSMIE